MTGRLDLDALLTPLPGKWPAGQDVRTDFDPQSRYFRLRDARAEARAAERQADAAGAGDDAPTARWAPVLELAVQLLTAETKDLEIAAWCTEALLRLDGLPGFAGGCALMQGLVERFWDDLHPLPGEDGIADRLAPVAGLNGEGGDGTLIQPLRKLPVLQRPDGTELALWQYQQSAEAAGMGDAARREQRIASGVLPFDRLESEARSAEPSAFQRLRRDAAAAAEAWRALASALDQRAGRDAPSTSRVCDLLDEIAGIAQRFAPAGAVAEAEQREATATPPEAADAALAGMPQRIANRADALRMLDEIADFFRRTEPHSPLAYTLYEATRRGRLTWPELLEEIVPDQDNRDAILRSLGIRPVPSPE